MLSIRHVFALSAAVLSVMWGPAAAAEDRYQWLEEVDAPAALDWVRARNADTLPRLEAAPAYTALHERLLKIYTSPQRLVPVEQMGDMAYNFWQDATHPRGVWRRTPLAAYLRGAPAWDTVLDVDALGRAEGQSWVWKGADCLPPHGRRCLISLSAGGGDAVTVREFDTVTRRFVPGGFEVPAAKSRVNWIDRDTLLVGTDFGPGSLTDSGYPRVLKRWRRGTPLAEAQTVFEARAQDVLVEGLLDRSAKHPRVFIRTLPTFFTETLHQLHPDGRLTREDKPDSAKAAVWRDWLVLELRDDWSRGGTTWPRGTLLALRRGQAGVAPQVLFAPQARTALESWHTLRSGLVLDVLDQVRGRVIEVQPRAGGWTRRTLALPVQGDVEVMPLDPEGSDDYLLRTSDHLSPAALSHVRYGRAGQRPLQTLPAFFNTAGLVAEQAEAVSRDGTRVPYFIVRRHTPDQPGPQPTVLYGYGGFEVALTPGYNAGVGAGWLERGGVWVEANIRGGGEFGPRWHAAALREKRQNAYDDFIAVAEDLVRRGITSPQKLAIMGGSNGGLLVGATMVQRPELFRAVVCQVPLLDMQRYHLLLAGASWMDEYGNPDKPEDWAYLSKYSPYQNLRPGVRYPRTLFVTSTRDDRVHPGHARKMAARMLEYGQDVWYYENMEGGHAAAADPRQRARMWALTWTFLEQTLR